MAPMPPLTLPVLVYDYAMEIQKGVSTFILMTGSYQVSRPLGSKRKSVSQYKGISNRGEKTNLMSGMEATHRLQLDSVNDR